jgi:hypothetical protein
MRIPLSLALDDCDAIAHIISEELAAGLAGAGNPATVESQR